MVTKVEITRTRAERVAGEVIGGWTPAEISQLLLVLAKEPAKIEGYTVTAKSPTLWPPICYAVVPEYDYYLVRVPRTKEGKL